MLACKHCLSFACKRSSKVHPANQRALVGQMRLLFSWKSIWKPCSLSAVTPNVHHACLYRVQQVLPRDVSSADSQLWWSPTKHIVTLPITRQLYCNLSHHLSSAFISPWTKWITKACLYEENLSQVEGHFPSSQINYYFLKASVYVSKKVDPICWSQQPSCCILHIVSP